MNLVNSPDCNPQPQEEDPLLKFINYARSALSPETDEDSDPKGNGAETVRPSWNWISSWILKTCSGYSSGVTAAILLSYLSQGQACEENARMSKAIAKEESAKEAFEHYDH